MAVTITKRLVNQNRACRSVSYATPNELSAGIHATQVASNISVKTKKVRMLNMEALMTDQSIRDVCIKI